MNYVNWAKLSDTEIENVVAWLDKQNDSALGVKTTYKERIDWRSEGFLG